MKYIVYKITNLINNKIYIGQTTESLKKRWKRHCGYQLNDKTYLHNTMKKYGIKNFSIEIIDMAKNQEELDEKEYFYIKLYMSDNKDIGYNLKNTKGKCGGDTITNSINKSNICKNISNSKKKNKNPNSKKIKAINILTKEEFIFNSMIECQEKLNICRHDIISRRCRNLIKKPYKNTWNFVYLNKCVSTNCDECNSVGQEISTCSKRLAVEKQNI